MRTFIIIILTLTIFIRANCQDKIYDTYTTDTIYLQEVQFKKVVSYQYNSVTFHVNYYDYKKALYVSWKRYHDGMKGTKKEKKGDNYINPDYEARWRTIDSVYKLLKKQVKTQDTIYLSQKVFDKVGLGALNNFFPDLIEKKQCEIINDKHQKQFLIIRHKGSRVNGPLDGYGGRAYYLPGQETLFIAARDWVS